MHSRLTVLVETKGRKRKVKCEEGKEEQRTDSFFERLLARSNARRELWYKSGPGQWDKMELQFSKLGV